MVPISHLQTHSLYETKAAEQLGEIYLHSSKTRPNNKLVRPVGPDSSTAAAADFVQCTIAKICKII